MSDERSSLGFLARVVRGLGDSRPRWWGRLVAAVLAPFLLAAGGSMVGMWAPATGELVRSIWWEETTGNLVEDHNQTAIRYSYPYQDETFSGTRFFFGDPEGKLADEEITRFAEDQKDRDGFQLFFNPDVPGESVVRRDLSPKSWLAVPFSMVLLFLGLVMAGYAVLPTALYWWRAKLRERFAEGVPDLISSSLKCGDAKLLFSSMSSVHRGFRLLGWAIFWMLLVLVVIVGGLLLLRAGEPSWRFVAWALLPFAVVGLVLVWITLRRFFGPQPPGLVFFFEGWRFDNSVGESDKVSVRWMSDPDEKDNFRSCRIGLGRWPNGQSFWKWKKNHPDWRDELVAISQGTVGGHGFDLEQVGRFDGPAMTGEEVHLVMIWQEWDGKVRQTSMYLGKLRAS